MEFRAVVKAARSDAYLCGEVFGLNPAWVGPDKPFDGLMNYFFGTCSLGFLGGGLELQQEQAIGGDFYVEPLDADTFGASLEKMLRAYDFRSGGTDAGNANFLHMNCIDSHDTARALHMLRGSSKLLALNVLFQCTMPGAPMVYYGNEIGVTGGRDPETRRAFPWHTPEMWDLELFDAYKRAIALRKKIPALRNGGWQRCRIIDKDTMCEPADAFAFMRFCLNRDSTEVNSGLSVAIVVLNSSNTKDMSTFDVEVPSNVALATLSLKGVRILKDLWGGGDSYTLEGHGESQGIIRNVRVQKYSAAVCALE